MTFNTASQNMTDASLLNARPLYISSISIGWSNGLANHHRWCRVVRTLAHHNILYMFLGCFSQHSKTQSLASIEYVYLERYRIFSLSTVVIQSSEKRLLYRRICHSL